MGFHLRQGSGGSCFSCGTCGGPSITGFSCVSRTGSANLRGYSKYANENSGDINLRKFTAYTHATSDLLYDQRFWLGDFGFPDQCTGHVGDSYQDITTPSGSWNVATNAQATSAQTTFVVCGVSGSVTNRSHTGFIQDTGGSVVNSDFNRTITQGAIDTGCFFPGAGCTGHLSRTSSYRVPTVHTITISAPDTVAAAHARGSPTVGSSCQTLPGTVGSTTASSTTQIALGSATRSVVVTISCTGLTISQDYEITASLTRRDSGTDAFISTTQVTITFTADAAVDTVDYDVPVETGTKVNFDSADSIAAA